MTFEETDDDEYEEYEFDKITRHEDGIGMIQIHIEQQIRKILEAGAGSHEPSELRPLREIMQNADDARADRLLILVKDEGLHFYNDGECLTRKKNKDGSISGSQKTINQINTDLSALNNKQVDPSVSGNFGTGLRSAHLFSDSLEIHSILYDMDTGQKRSYIGIASYNQVDLKEPKGVQADVLAPRRRKNRPHHKKPMRTGFTDFGCVHFILKWRTMDSLAPNRISKDDFWVSRTWNDEKVSGLFNHYKDNIASILLSCRHLREVVLSIDGIHTETVGFSRDFDLDGSFYSLTKTNTKEPILGTLSFYSSKKNFDVGTLFVNDLNGFLSLDRKIDYNLFLDIASDEQATWAEESNLEPYYGLIVPSPSESNLHLLPVYTPIALAASKEKRNYFGPIGYMPPHESRRYVLLSDQMSRSKLNWAHHIMASMSSSILPKILNWLESSLHSGKITTQQLMKLLPRRKPDVWFSESENGLGVKSIDSAWSEYLQSLSDCKLFLGVSGNFVGFDKIIRIDVKDNSLRFFLEQLLDLIGEDYLPSNQEEILQNLHRDDWDQYHPTKKMRPLSSPMDLLKILDTNSTKLNLKNLGKKLTKTFIELCHSQPPKEWEGQELYRNLIPCIPNVKGELCPLKENDLNHFYLASSEFPDLLPSHRIIHKDFIHLSNFFQLEHPRSEDLAKLVDEAVEISPKVYSNLQDFPQIHKQVSAALAVITQNPPTLEMAEYRFIPIMHKGKIQTMGLPKISTKSQGMHIWPISQFNSVRHNFFRRDLYLRDSPKNRTNLHLHDEIIANLFWLELHQDVESERERIAGRLQLHEAYGEKPGINIIRTLVFSQVFPGITAAPLRSVFSKENGVWGLDDWLGRKLNSTERDEMLESLLQLLRNAADKNSDKTLSGESWGAGSRQKVHNLYLLKDEKNEWSTLNNLCYELDKDLSVLFNKTAVLASHKELLGIDIITSEIGKGLGVTHRIDELDITDKLNTISESDVEVRSKMVGMMLRSNDTWELSEDVGLEDISWIPNTQKELVRFDELILPTPNIESLLGPKHPRYVLSNADYTTTEVLERAKELGIECDENQTELILSALLEPPEIWSGLNGKEVLHHLQKAHSTGFIPSKTYHRSRLPDSDGIWHDDSWLIAEKMQKYAQTIYPNRNIVTSSQIGGVDVENMVYDWILPASHGPSQTELIIKLQQLSEAGSSMAELRDIEAIWELISYSQKYDSLDLLPDLDKNKVSSYLFAFDGKIIKLSDLFFVSDGDEHTKFVQLPSLTSFSYIFEDHPMAKLLQDYFFVVNLEDCNQTNLVNAIEFTQYKGFSSPSIDRYWVILASQRRGLSGLVGKPYWLYKLSGNYSFTEAKPPVTINRRALIPEKEDSHAEIKRMTDSGLGLLWLPQDDVLQDLIYSQLEKVNETDKLPFLRLQAKSQSEGLQLDDKENWPMLTNALRNIVKALSLTNNLGLSQALEDVKVSKTKMAISSKLFATTAAGWQEVFWKNSELTDPMLLTLDEANASLELVISLEGSDLEDYMIFNALKRVTKKGTASKNTLNRLITLPESQWHTIDDVLNSEVQQWSVHERGLISIGMYKEYAENMAKWYGMCQICERQTPSDRSGKMQESVVSLFKEKGGRYYSNSIRYQQGNVMYLCPVHKSLYSRSKNCDLMWIPDIDKAKTEIEKTPTQEKVDELVNSILKMDGKMELVVKTWEKEPNDGEPGPTEKSHRVTWHKKHASGFRDALTQYLTGLIN